MSNAPDLAQLRSRYTEDGYAVLPSLLDADQVASIAHEASELCRGRLGEFHGIQPGGEHLRYPSKPSDAVAVEVPAGSVVLFNGYLLHRSLANATPDRFRRALVYHYMRAESLLPWFATPSFNGITFGTLDVRDVVMVAGTDPYADKGYESVNAAFVRPACT